MSGLNAFNKQHIPIKAIFHRNKTSAVWQMESTVNILFSCLLLVSYGDRDKYMKPARNRVICPTCKVQLDKWELHTGTRDWKLEALTMEEIKRFFKKERDEWFSDYRYTKVSIDWWSSARVLEKTKYNKIYGNDIVERKENVMA